MAHGVAQYRCLVTASRDGNGSNPARIDLNNCGNHGRAEIFALPQPNRLVRFHRFGDRFLDWEPLHAGGAVKAVDAFGPM